MQTDKNVELSSETIKRLARAIKSSTLKDFYSDPENAKAFEEWKTENKNAAEMQRNERN